MAHESACLSGGFEGTFLEENLNIKKEEVTFEAFNDSPDNCEEIFAHRKRVETLEGGFRCDVSPKTFASSTHLPLNKRNHKISTIHKGEKTYPCDLCDRCYRSSKGLTVHKRMHAGEKPYQCDLCNQSFTQTSNLIAHRRIHTGEKPHQCDQCSRCFNSTTGLTIHKRTHTGEKPYPCDQCDKSFIGLPNLKLHKRIHSGEKPYLCEQCNKSFTSRSDLKHHKRIHTGEKPYQCDQCGKCFSRSWVLTIHKRTHTGEKPFLCCQCKKSFISAAKLAIHKRRHMRESLYQCDQCPQSFADSASLRVHALKEHEQFQQDESDVGSLFGFVLCDNKFKNKQERRRLEDWNSCNCKFSESELQEISVSKPSKCMKCEKYISSKSSSEAVSQSNQEGSSLDQLESFQDIDGASSSKRDQSTWKSSALEAIDNVFEAVDVCPLQKVKEEELD